MEARQSPVSFGQVLRNRPFLLLWLANLVSTFGDWLALFALFSLVAFRFKGTPNQVAGIFISFIIPWALLGPIAGVFVDRWNVKRTLIGSDLIRALIAALLALSSGLPQTYALVFVLSFVSCFFVPAQNVAIPLLVSKEELLVANALNQQTTQVNRIIAPAIAGLLVAWAGEKACFYVDSLTFIFSAGMISRLALARPPAPSEGGIRAILGQLKEGLKFLFQHRALFFVTVALVAAVFAIGAFDALVAVYVRDILHAQARTFGGVVSLAGLGLILGAALIGRFGQRQSKVLLVVWGILGVGLGIFALAAASRAPQALAISVWLGFAASAVMVPSQTLVQQETPQLLLGRVSSSSGSLITVSQLVAVAISGRLATWLGIRNLYFLVALALVVIGAAGFVYARVGRIEETSPASVPT